MKQNSPAESYALIPYLHKYDLILKKLIGIIIIPQRQQLKKTKFSSNAFKLLYASILFYSAIKRRTGLWDF